jgi:hypothetical protein
MLPKVRVTKEQRQGKKGQGQVDECFSDLGWEPRPLTPDLGEDFIIDIYDEGVSAGLAFYAQVKSSESLTKFLLKTGDYSYPIEVKDLNHWRDYMPPVVLIIWDTTQRQGYWVAIADAITCLDKVNPVWQNRVKKAKSKEPKVNVLVPSANIVGQNTLKSLREKVATLMLPAIIEGKKLTLTLHFSFPNDSQGSAQQEALKRFLDFGEGVSIDGKFIKGIQMPDWYERKLGKPAINPEGKFVFGPRHSNQTEKFRLTLLSPEGRILQVEVIEVKAVRAGNKRLTFRNEHMPTPFAFQMIMEGGYYSINISIHGTRTTAGEALRAYSFFDNSRRGGRLRLEVLTNSEKWGRMGRFEVAVDEKTFPEVDHNFRAMLQKLHLIECKTGVTFTLTDEGVGKKDWQAIHEVAGIIESGRISAPFQKQTQTLHGAVEADAGLSVIKALLSDWRENKPVSLQGQTQEVEAEILGVNVPLGSQNMRLTGKLEPECAKKLEEMEKAGISPKDLEFVLIDGTSEEEFPEWLSEPSALPPFPEKT